MDLGANIILLHNSEKMKRKAAGKSSKGKGRKRQPTPPNIPTPPPAEQMEVDVADSVAESVAAESVATESVAGDVGDDELAASSQSKKARVLSSLTYKEQENVALFLERNMTIYNKRQIDHTFASKKNKAWEDLALEMGKEMEALTTFYESIHRQIGKLRRKKSGQGTVELRGRQQRIWDRFQFLLPHIGQVTRRTVRSFRSGDTTIHGEDKPHEEEPQSPVTTTSSTCTITTGTLTETVQHKRSHSEGG